jgi:hypothetical protein
MDSQDVTKQFAAFVKEATQAKPAVVEQPAVVIPEEPIFTSQTVPTSDPNLMMGGLFKLLEILTAREARLEQAERSSLEAAARRDAQVRQNNKDWNRNFLLTQAKCKHQKGYWSKGPAPIRTDYAVYQHTFIDMKRQAKCRICKMTWRPEDTKDFLVINGQQVKNHTGIGWEDAENGKISVLSMLAASSDKPSASEAPLYGQLPSEVNDLLVGRPPDFISQLLNSPEGRAFLERTTAKK